MNTGHTTFSTLHAGSVDSAIHRLENEPLNVPKAMIASLNIVSSQIRLYREGKQIRRCSEIVEIMGVSETKDVVVNTVFKYRPDTDSVIYSARSEIYRLNSRSATTAMCRRFSGGMQQHRSWFFLHWMISQSFLNTAV